MRLGNKREGIWKKYKNIELMIRELSSIAQNDMDVTDEMLERHETETKKIINELNKINIELQ